MSASSVDAGFAVVRGTTFPCICLPEAQKAQESGCLGALGLDLPRPSGYGNGRYLPASHGTHFPPSWAETGPSGFMGVS